MAAEPSARGILDGRRLVDQRIVNGRLLNRWRIVVRIVHGWRIGLVLWRHGRRWVLRVFDRCVVVRIFGRWFLDWRVVRNGRRWLDEQRSAWFERQQF